MAAFTLVDIDYDQRGFGAMAPVPELQAQLPLAASLARRMPGPDRDDYFIAVLERPIKHRPGDQFDWARAQPEFVAADSSGQFVWLFAIVIASLMVGTRLHAGMRGMPVFVAYVVDNTITRDEVLNFDKCEPVGWGTINDLEQPAEKA